MIMRRVGFPVFLTLLFFFDVSIANGDGGEAVFPCSITHAEEKVGLKSGTFYVCYFGGAPESMRDGWRHVAGVSFNRLLPQAHGRSELILQVDELEYGVDYRVTDDRLEVLTYFDTYHNFEKVKFLREVVDLSQIPAKHTKNLIYSPKPVSKLEVDEAIAFLDIKEDKYQKAYQEKYGPGKIYEKLFKIRDYAFSNPAYAREALGKMQAFWWNDGEVAEVLDSIRTDIEVLAKMRGTVPSNRPNHP